MTPFQQKLYDDLMRLVASNEAFYFQDFDLEGHTYRIFNYRLASYTDFQAPNALECRGHMFEVDAAGVAIRLAALPMQKFFNLNENPSTMGLDLSLVDTVELKADGSLMSTYQHECFLRLKSKGSLFSTQAVDAHRWVTDVNPPLKRQLLEAEIDGWTVNLEWCAPDNRIVIGYLEPHLRVLNARHRDSGAYMSRDELVSRFNQDVIDRVDTNGLDPAAFILSIPSMQDDIEGYVARIGDKWFKVKTDKYLSLHHAKDSVNNPRRLFEAILDEGIDDLRSMFAQDVLAMKTIDDMQIKVDHVYNSMVKMVEAYHDENKHLDRKEYAIKGQEHFKGTLYFSLAMTKYIGKPVEYKQFLKSKWKELGFRDTSTEKSSETSSD